MFWTQWTYIHYKYVICITILLGRNKIYFIEWENIEKILQDLKSVRKTKIYFLQTFHSEPVLLLLLKWEGDRFQGTNYEQNS